MIIEIAESSSESNGIGILLEGKLLELVYAGDVLRLSGNSSKFQVFLDSIQEIEEEGSDGTPLSNTTGSFE